MTFCVMVGVRPLNQSVRPSARIGIGTAMSQQTSAAPQPVPDAPPFERRVEFTRSPGAVLAEVDDCQHHLAVTIRHDGAHVTGFDLDPIRAPWSPCAAAVERLDEFVGVPVGVRPVTARPDQHCTHQLDVTLAGIRFAGLAVAHRRYLMTVGGYLEPVTTATLVRDDGFELVWTLRDGVVTSPAEHAGHGLRAGFTGWALTLPPDEAEAVLLLRRAAWMAPARLIDLDDFPTMHSTGMREGVCFAAQPERIHVATRVLGSSRVGHATRPPSPGT